MASQLSSLVVQYMHPSLRFDGDMRQGCCDIAIDRDLLFHGGAGELGYADKRDPRGEGGRGLELD